MIEQMTRPLSPPDSGISLSDIGLVACVRYDRNFKMSITIFFAVIFVGREGTWIHVVHYDGCYKNPYIRA